MIDIVSPFDHSTQNRVPGAPPGAANRNLKPLEQSLGVRLCNQHEKQRLLRPHFVTKLTDPDRRARIRSMPFVLPHPRTLRWSFTIGSKSG
jgi:hypothetical protein